MDLNSRYLLELKLRILLLCIFMNAKILFIFSNDEKSTTILGVLGKFYYHVITLKLYEIYVNHTS